MELTRGTAVYLGVIKHNGRQLWKILIPGAPLIPTDPHHRMLTCTFVSWNPENARNILFLKTSLWEGVTYIRRYCPTDKPSSLSTPLDNLESSFLRQEGQAQKKYGSDSRGKNKGIAAGQTVYWLLHLTLGSSFAETTSAREAHIFLIFNLPYRSVVCR